MEESLIKEVNDRDTAIADVIKVVEEFWNDFCPITLSGKKIMPLHEFYVYVRTHDLYNMEQLLDELLPMKKSSKLRNGKLRFLLFTTRIYNAKHKEYED